jgi:hypothetical protein
MTSSKKRMGSGRVRRWVGMGVVVGVKGGLKGVEEGVPR